MTVDDVQIVLPAVHLQASFEAGISEFRAEGRYLDWASIWTPDAFAMLVAQLRDSIHTPSDRPFLVPSTIYWIVVDSQWAGRVSLRHRLTDDLRQIGGHIGYEVRPSLRGRGIATRALALVLIEARRIGLDRVLITCDRHNVASRKVIEANGGLLADEIQVADQDSPTCRYWIDLTARAAAPDRDVRY